MPTDEKGSDEREEPIVRSFELNFHGWNIGGKLVFIATILAILSLLLPWIGENAETEMGFRQGMSVFLAFYIYPFFILVQDKTMSKSAGGLSSILAVIAPGFLLYYLSRDMALRIPEIMDWGIILFLIASILLIIGVFKYERYYRHGEPEEKESQMLEKKKKRGKPCPECDSPMEYEEEWERWYCEKCDKYQ